MKTIKKHKTTLIIILLILIIISSNTAWYLIFQKETSRAKNSLLPGLENDYYSKQLSLTKHAEEIYQSYEYESGYIPIYKDIKDVPLVTQNPKYPNGCEAASATMLLNYYGINITIEEFLKYLHKKDVYIENGTRYGPDPSLYYAGNPEDETKGWGCFDLAISTALTSIIFNYNSNIFVNLNYDKLPLSLIPSYPSIIWVTIDYEEANEVFTWLSYDGKTTYTYPRNEHVVVLTGQDEKYYYINDPLKNEKNIPVLKEKLEKSFNSLGRQYISLEEYLK